MLTAAQQALLEQPFKPEEHRFDASGNLYVDKAAFRRRFSQVDPGWSQTPPVVVSQTPNTVTLAATITISGSTRSASGVSIINRWKKGVDPNTKKEIKVEIEGYDLARAEKLAYKSADSDLLPRIAQQFNCGWYLKLSEVKNVKTEAQLKAFLSKLPGGPSGSHWADNGGRQRVAAFLAKIGLEWAQIKDMIEPGKTLTILNDTMLDETAFLVRLAEIAFKPAGPQTPPPSTAQPTQPAPAASEPTTPPPPPAPEKPAPASPSAALAPGETHIGPSWGSPFDKRDKHAASPAPAGDVIINLADYFSSPAAPAAEPKAESTPSAPERPRYGYGSPASRDQRTVRNYKRPSGRGENLGYIKIRARDLIVDDIVTGIIDGGIARILTIGAPEANGDRQATVLQDEIEKPFTFGTVSLYMLVGGPTHLAVQDNPALAPVAGSGHRVYEGQKVEATS